jgi:YD repeat-containing protein
VNASNAALQLTQFSQNLVLTGATVATTQSYDPATGRLTAIQAGNGNAVQNLAYSWDALGNLACRIDYLQTSLYESFTYDAIGNITAKSDTGSYSYPASGAASGRPHAVASVAGTLNATYSYDANGNLLSGAGPVLTWTSFNKPASIASGGVTLSFSHGPEHDRFKEISPRGTTLTLADGVSGIRVEKLTGTGALCRGRVGQPDAVFPQGPSGLGGGADPHDRPGLRPAARALHQRGPLRAVPGFR